jgi:hypothetical protein
LAIKAQKTASALRPETYLRICLLEGTKRAMTAGQSHERWNDVAGGRLTDGEIHFSLLMKDKRGESRPISEQSACHLRQKGSKLP